MPVINGRSSRLNAETEGLTFRIQITVDGYTGKLLLKLIFHLPLDYPSSLPDVSVISEELTRKQCIDIKLGLLKKATLVSEPMVHKLRLWLQQNFMTVTEQSDYRLLQKTLKVDVDSSGKKCKEKMMSVLWEMQLPCGCKQ
ncbi:RWD domain-containing protein 3 [Acipenser ruthenus]|uniref:RWD domain-containing protein 3 n=1 Tax=Acipenser ruthenus TaxID=7906 RepID=A0A444UJV1_ACIRT|nr:RWD domain-containing protein 3 [Acipenser ruthenus]